MKRTTAQAIRIGQRAQRGMYQPRKEEQEAFRHLIEIVEQRCEKVRAA